MLIFVALSGKSLELAVDGGTRVALVMDTLAVATSISPAEQVLMCHGSRLDPSKTLSAYGLPGAASSGVKDVFLYNKSHLRQQGLMPPQEAAKPLDVQEPLNPEQSEHQAHALDSARSPLVRALPQYQRQFQWHLQVAKVGLQASEQRHRDCSTLVSEMEVQSRAIDSARNSVEIHYTHIHSQIAAFTQRYKMQQKAHADVLSGFERELDALEAIELIPAAQTPSHTKLIDLVDAAKLREWAGRCQTAHQSLAQKVTGLEELFAAIKTDVEAVFMQAPTVQLEALATHLNAMKPHLEELGSIVQVLERDDAQIERLVDTAKEELRGRRAGGASKVTPLDTCQLMETMHENHSAHLVPQIEHYRTIFEHFYGRCLEDKNQMTRDVAAQLQQISAQQVRIQAARNKLAIFREAAAKEDEMIAQLLLVRRIPAAYRHCLAECIRRKAFGELYAGQASQLAERMGRLREKECEVRDNTLRQIQVYIPAEVLSGLGLMHQPAHCQITLPQQPELPNISLSELHKVPTSTDPSASAATTLPFGTGDLRPAAQISPRLSHAHQSGGFEERSEATAGSLEIENARLRSELAMRIANECSQRISSSLSSSDGLPQLRGSGSHSDEAPAAQPRQASDSSSAPHLSADAQRFQAAASASQDLAQRLDRQLVQSQRQVASYEARIRTLESRLAQQVSAEQPGLPLHQSHARGAVKRLQSSQEAQLQSSGGHPVPLALTPVLTSPTRSISPATGHALPDPEALRHGGSAVEDESGFGKASGDPLLEAVSSSLQRSRQRARVGLQELDSLGTSSAALTESPAPLDAPSRDSDATSPSIEPESIGLSLSLEGENVVVKLGEAPR